MEHVNYASPLLSGIKEMYASLTDSEREQLLQHPIVVLYLQEAAYLSELENSGKAVSQWTLSLHEDLVRLLEHEFLCCMRAARRRSESA